MAEEIADGGCGLSGDRIAVFFPDGEIFEFGKVFGNGIVEIEFPFVEKHHGGGRSDAFGHGVDTKEGVFFNVFFLGAISEAELLLVNDVAFTQDNDGSAGEAFFFDQVFDRRIDSGESFRGHSDVFGLADRERLVGEFLCAEREEEKEEEEI